jgi:hypothetical protein
MKYKVHLFAVVRVRIDNIEATSQLEAIKKAENDTDLYRQFLWESRGGEGGTDPYVNHTEWADEISHVLVDEEGDEEYEQSGWYGTPDDRESHDEEGEWLPTKQLA